MRKPRPRRRDAVSPTTTLNLRGLPISVAERARAAASARRMSLPQYVAALVALHDAIRARADHGGEDGRGDPALQAELEAVGLQTIRA